MILRDLLIGFVKTHITDHHESEVVGEISCGTSQSDDKSSSDTQYTLCQLTKIPGVVVVSCDFDVKPDETFLWTQQVTLPTLSFCHYCVISLSSTGDVHELSQLIEVSCVMPRVVVLFIAEKN